MTKAVFQAGVSWAMIDNKWKGFLDAFEKFDPRKVAAFDEADIERLMQSEGIVRSRKKIEGTIKNARVLLELDKEHGSFQNYLHSKGSYDELGKDIKRRFSYMGELNVYYFLFRIKEPVPPFDQWITTIEGDHPRMKEMVELALKKKAR
jgi:DNA-3-methyladenine glycosylase I